ncbi:MAG: sporulation protein [Halobacteriales archaeon]
MIRARVGLGSATVDTILPAGTFAPGDDVEGTIAVTGGRADQRIDEFHCSVVAVGEGDEEYEIAAFDLLEGFLIEAGETERVPFTVTFPVWTPVTRGDVGARLEVGADIAWAVDPHDSVDLEVAPDPLLAAALEAVAGLEFEFGRSWLQAVDWLEDRPFVQVFAFEPGANYEDRVERLLLTPILEADRLRLHVEIDRVDAVANEYDLDFNRDEVPFVVETADPSMIQGRIRNEIEQHS